MHVTKVCQENDCRIFEFQLGKEATYQWKNKKHGLHDATNDIGERPMIMDWIQHTWLQNLWKSTGTTQERTKVNMVQWGM